MAGSIYKKIAQVMANINRIPKRGFNKHHNYDYVLEADLLDNIRPILLEAKLVLFPTILEEQRTGDFTKVKMEFTLADIETGETIKSVFWGEGQDKQDKGLYKAYTGATKYFLMKTFLIPTGDDPETEEQPKPQQKQQTQKQHPKQQAKEQPQPQNQNQQNQPERKLTDKQLNKIIAEGNKKGLNDAAQKALVYFHFKKKSRKDLSTQEASKFIDILIETPVEQLWKDVKSVLNTQASNVIPINKNATITDDDKKLIDELLGGAK